MSYSYRDSLGVEHPIAGMIPSGSLVPSATYQQSGTGSATITGNGGSTTAVITFETPMPDTNYMVNIVGTIEYNSIITQIVSQTTGGFKILFTNEYSTQLTYTYKWTAFKLITNEDRALDEQAIASLQTDKQNKTLTTPLTIGGTQQTTVEDALGGFYGLLTEEPIGSYNFSTGGNSYQWLDLGTSPNVSNSQAFLLFEITYGRVDGLQTKAFVTCGGTMADANYINVYNLTNAQTSASEQFIIDSNKHIWFGMQSYCYAHIKVYGRWTGFGDKSLSTPAGASLTVKRTLSTADLTSTVTSGSTAPITSGGVYDTLNPTVIEITGTTGSTSQTAGALNVLKTTYPQYRRLIPFGFSTDNVYEVRLAQDNSNTWVFLVDDRVTKNWASGVSISFKCYAYKY